MQMLRNVWNQLRVELKGLRHDLKRRWSRVASARQEREPRGGSHVAQVKRIIQLSTAAKIMGVSMLEEEHSQFRDNRMIELANSSQQKLFEEMANLKAMSDDLANAASLVIAPDVARCNIGLRVTRKRNLTGYLKNSFERTSTEPGLTGQETCITRELLGKTANHEDWQEVLRQALALDGKALPYSSQMSSRSY